MSFSRSLHLQLRRQLAQPTTTIALCVMGLLVGVLAAAVIVVFRLGILWLGNSIGNHSQWQQFMPNGWRFGVPIAAAAVIYLLMMVTRYRRFRLGIPFVIHRMKQHYGMLPWRSTVNQFFAGIIALTAGFSVGREGPAVHLGAAISTWFGHRLQVPYNSIRTLAACGIAAAIACSFGTPLAAMVLVMEVVLREYKVHIFIPVMLAAVSGALITREVFGTATDLAMLVPEPLTPMQLPWVVMLGILLGLVGVLFKALMLDMMRTAKHTHVLTRFLFAGLMTGALGLIIPAGLGPGLTAIHQVIVHQQELNILFTLLFAKLITSAIALGMGIPGGLIGAVFGIGAIVAALFTASLASLGLHTPLPLDIFLLLGMAGLLTATIHAPLAALLAVMELSRSPEVIVPAMLVIVTAYLISSQLFKSKSIFIAQLDLQELPYQISPVTLALQKTGIEAVMDRDYMLLKQPTHEQITDALQNADTQSVIIQSYDAEQQPLYHIVSYDIMASDASESSLNYTPLTGLKINVTLSEAYDILAPQRRGAVYIYDESPTDIIGVVSWDMVRKALDRELP
ncbi:chloride channel protein [Idiomarina xiamenensis]|uniref:Chloride channel protein EriC n=1 Tax=Idiomarina xiamenensis 10-D-4 TaxID=740709 RepID=K2LC80_9GAMM|nr:chloride channel protein [Idiomarina xiamenensis]EKE87465.1 chloride channel protein EriC [Idiomarina xiamenensis 10-D-4]